jgi:plasmid stability protein
VKNITLSVPDEVYRAARIRAAERGTSVSALVARYLEELSADPGTDDSRSELMRAIEKIRRSNPGFSAKENVPRDELYDRGAR